MSSQSNSLTLAFECFRFPISNLSQGYKPIGRAHPRMGDDISFKPLGSEPSSQHNSPFKKRTSYEKSGLFIHFTELAEVVQTNRVFDLLKCRMFHRFSTTKPMPPPSIASEHQRESTTETQRPANGPPSTWGAGLLD